MRVPAFLNPGSRVVVIAPSSAFPRERFLPGLAWLASRYDVVMRSSAFARRGYLAGSDARRSEELQNALSDPKVAAIWAARGGYGATRIIDALDWRSFEQHPKWLIGFSDITALHLRAQSLNVCSIHGANVSGVREGSALEQLQMLNVLEGAARSASLTDLVTLRRGSAPAQGTLFGGNLSLVAAEAAAGRMVPPEDALWVLEDISERPYRVDRMLTSLLPYLRRARGIVFGDFSECAPGPDGVTIEQVLEELEVPCPTYRGARFGHGKRNPPLVLGAQAEVLDDSLVTRW